MATDCGGSMRFKQPIDMLVVPDYPNTCPFDGARTVQLEQRDGHTVEKCPQCSALLNFWDDDAN